MKRHVRIYKWGKSTKSRFILVEFYTGSEMENAWPIAASTILEVIDNWIYYGIRPI